MQSPFGSLLKGIRAEPTRHVAAIGVFEIQSTQWELWSHFSSPVVVGSHSAEKRHTPVGYEREPAMQPTATAPYMMECAPVFRYSIVIMTHPDSARRVLHSLCPEHQGQLMESRDPDVWMGSGHRTSPWNHLLRIAGFPKHSLDLHMNYRNIHERHSESTICRL